MRPSFIFGTQLFLVMYHILTFRKRPFLKEDADTAPDVFRPCLSVNTGGLPKITESP